MIRRSTQWSAAVLATGLALGCAPPAANQPSLSDRVSDIETTTESFANAMLDMSAALVADDWNRVLDGVADSIAATPFPTEPLRSTSEGPCTARLHWSVESVPTELSRTAFVDSIDAFVHRFAELDDGRFKVKGSLVSEPGDTIEATVAISLIGRNREGRREWITGRASVESTRDDAQRWRLRRFVITELSSQVALSPIMEEVSLNAGVSRIAATFDARTDPPFAAYGAAAGDLDNDGLIDIIAVGDEVNSVYINRGDGTFEEVGDDVYLRSIPGDATAPLIVDYDGDGDLDVFFSAIGAQMLMENRLVPDGALSFWDVSLQSGVARQAIGFSAVAGDVDGNGTSDIYVTSYQRYGQILPNSWDSASNGTPNLLFLNRGDGSFDEVASDWGVADSRWGYAAAFADIDRDGDLDLYATNDFGGGNALFINHGDRFVDESTERGVYDGGYGMGASFGDVDNDGAIDLHVTRMSSTAGRRILARVSTGELTARDQLEALAVGNALYRNDGRGFFEDITQSTGPFPAGWAWGGGFIDINNDGWEDVYTPNGFISGSRQHDT